GPGAGHQQVAVDVRRGGYLAHAGLRLALWGEPAGLVRLVPNAPPVHAREPVLALVLVAVRAAVAAPRGAHELRVLLRARPPGPRRRLDPCPLVGPDGTRAGRVEVHRDPARRRRPYEFVVGVPGMMRVGTRLRTV